MSFTTRIIGNMAGVWVSAFLVPGILFTQGSEWWWTVLDLFLIALTLTLVNSIIRPVVKFLTFPLYILTLGLFTVITNGMMFWIVGWLSSQFNLPLDVEGFWPAVWAGLVTAIIAAIVAGILGLLVPRKPLHP